MNFITSLDPSLCLNFSKVVVKQRNRVLERKNETTLSGIVLDVSEAFDKV